MDPKHFVMLYWPTIAEEDKQDMEERSGRAEKEIVSSVINDVL